MAKQSGLHQIRGKVGEHSYYKQSGVASGLIRSINQGMSARVKNDAAFANTRLNNAEFGQASRMAAVLGQLIIPKYRPMILPFSQSKMAKILLDAIKTKSGPWGERNLSSLDLSVFLAAINSTAKNNAAEWGLNFSIDEDDNFVIKPDQILFDNKLTAIGAAGVSYCVLAARPWFGTYSSADGKYAQSYARANVYQGTLNDGSEEAKIDYSFRPAPPTGWPAFDVDFFVVVLMPFRDLGGKSNILQEHCTFIAVETPQEQ